MKTMRLSLKAQDLIFLLALLFVVGLAVWDARVWEIKARLFPWVIGWPLLAMILIQVGLTFIRPPREKPAEQTVEVDAATLRRRAVAFVVWILVFAAGLWLLGYLVGATILTATYLYFQAREGWKVILGVSAATFAVIWVMQNVLYTPFPKPMLLQWLGIEI